jgi:hypothetical protein
LMLMQDLRDEPRERNGSPARGNINNVNRFST